MIPALPEYIGTKKIRKGGMMIVTVSGAHSGIGKTKLAESLLKKLPGWSALKVTVTRNGKCPRDNSCGICEEQSAPFSIVSDSKIINQEGKDTQRLRAAGAKKVLWLKARPDSLKQGLKTALKRLQNKNGIVIEGTSVLKYIKPDLGLFIDAKGKTFTIINRTVSF